MSTCSSCRRLDRGVCVSAYKPADGCTPNAPCCKDYQYVKRTEEEVERLFAPFDEAVQPASQLATGGIDVVDVGAVAEEATLTEVVNTPAAAATPQPTEAATDVDAGEADEGTLIDLTQFSDRAVKAIEALDVTTYEELAGTPDDVIDAIKGIGDVTIKEICSKLIELGFLESPGE